MPQSYLPEFKKKIVCIHLKKDVPKKESLQSMGYPKQASPSGVLNLVRNAVKKPF